MTNPFAPHATFPDVRLARAGVEAGEVDELRTRFDAATADQRRDLARTVASVSDRDLVGDDGALCDILTGWPADPAPERTPTAQEQAQAGLPPTDGPLYDPTEHTLDDADDGVEAYLAAATTLEEVDRVAQAELDRTDRTPRKGVAEAADEARERLAAAGD